MISLPAHAPAEARRRPPAATFGHIIPTVGSHPPGPYMQRVGREAGQTITMVGPDVLYITITTYCTVVHAGDSKRSNHIYLSLLYATSTHTRGYYILFSS
eukprot:454938-Pyramimonas_sp.AAC.3